MAEIALTPLRCIKCNTNVLMEPDEAVCVCAECGQGMLLNEATGLETLEIRYTAGVQGTGRPFWVASGAVALQRDTYGFGDKDSEAAKFWGAPRVFYIPAFTCAMDDLVSIGMKFVQQPPPLQQGPRTRFAPVTLPIHDVRDVAEFVVMGIEAARSDKLKKLDFTLNLGKPELWILGGG